MPFAYWNEATDHVRTLSRIAAEVWDCEPFTYNPNGGKVPLLADFCPHADPVIWYPGDPLCHAVQVIGPPLPEMRIVESVVTTAPSRPERGAEVQSFASACRAVAALAKHTTPRRPAKSYRGIATALVPPPDESGTYRTRIAGDGYQIASVERPSEAEAKAVQDAWMRWIECSWYRMRTAALKHGWRVLGESARQKMRR